VRLPAAPVLALILAASGALAAEGEAAPPRLRLEVPGGPASAGASVVVRVHALDARGRPESVTVALDADGGEVSEARRVSPGVYEALLTVPSRLPPVRSILLLARTDASHAELAVPLVPGAVAAAFLDGVDTCAEGSENCPVVLRVEDAAGNGVDEHPLVRSERGKVISVRASEPGRWVLAYRAPALEHDDRDQITAEVGKLRATHPLRIVPSRTRLAMAFRGGMARQDGRLGPAAGGQLFVVTRAGGWLAGGGVQAEWWRVRRTGTAAPPVSLSLVDERAELSLGLCGVLEHAVGRSALFWLSGSAGAARVESRTRLSGQPAVVDAAWTAAAGGAAAIGWRTRAGIPFLEVRGAWTGDPKLPTVAGASGALLLELGYRLDAR